MQILFSLKLSVLSCSVLGNSSLLPFGLQLISSLLFCFRTRGSILLPLRKLSDIVIIRQKSFITSITIHVISLLAVIPGN